MRGSALEDRPLDPERVLLSIMVGAHVVVVLIAIVAEASGWERYRHPWLSLAALLFVVAESTWFAVAGWSGRMMDGPLAVGLLLAAGLVAVLGCGLAMRPSDRLHALNWGNVFGIAAVSPSAMVVVRRLPVSAAIVAASAAGTLVLAHRSGHVIDRVTTGGYYVFLAALTRYLSTQIRRWGTEQDRQYSLRQEAERALAAEQERNRQHRMVHDTALQILEALGAGLPIDERIRARCRQDAAQLRSSLEGRPRWAGDALFEMLRNLARDFEAEGLSVILTQTEAVAPITEEVRVALLDATRESLRNVLRHAGVRSAVVSVQRKGGGVCVVVRDQGAGFDQARREGFGTASSIRGRIEEAGGRVEIWSRPARGTRVTLWAPAP